MDERIKDRFTDQFFKAILLLENEEECQKFLEDICTINEIKSIAQRLEVAKMLKEGATYEEIAKMTGASTATISRVKKCLNYGANGYQIILGKLGIE
ncbi:MAG: helix-turn-helix domain-containing protein [Halanaerobiales bacterium]|nr:helix-turn-helix domain-containing protein [Halanaerobiales bacterium]